MSEKKCVNCRHNICKENPSGNIECVCEITNEHIGYVKCFDGWCRHWAKDNKLFVCPDQPEELEVKATDLENTEIAKSFEQELKKHNQAKYDWWQQGNRRMGDGKEAKFLFLDDLSQPKSENNTVVDIEKSKGIVKQWYEHCVGRSNFTVLGGTVMSKGDFDKFTKKEQNDD